MSASAGVAPWIGIATVIALSASTVTAAHAEAPAESAPTALGGFAVGDGLEALLEPRDGSLSFSLPVGPLALSWDSRRLGSDRYELGEGWSLGVPAIDTNGGPRVVPLDGLPREMDASSPSGLAGYDLIDVRFAPGDGTVAARSGGAWGQADASPGTVVDARTEAFVLEQLGGVRTSYDANGDPIASVNATGARLDWVWEEASPHRLRRMVDARGVVTELDRSRDRELVVRAGANLPSLAGGAAGSAEGAALWRIGFDAAGRVERVVDPIGARIELGYHEGVIASVRVPTGATTLVEWTRSAEGAARVQRLRTVDESGFELSERTWHQAGTSSGWPLLGDAGSSAGVAGRPYATMVADGPTTVRSEYDEAHRLRTRTMHTATSSGEVELVRQILGYADDDSSGSGAAGAHLAKPTSVRIEHRSPRGDARATEETFAYDEAGRVVRRHAADGSTTTTEFDRVIPAGRSLPIGLVTRETVTTADGLMRETVHELNPERSAVVATETRVGTTTDQAAAVQLTPTARTEYVVESDGFVSEERAYPGGDRTAAPLVTTRSEVVDPVRGVLTQVEITAAGTSVAASESRTVSLLHGGVLETTDAAGRTGSAVTDVLGRPILATDPAGLTVGTAYETMQHDGRNATAVSLPGGVVATEERDALGRVIRLTDNIRDGVATPGFERVAETRSYPAPGVVRVTDAWGATTETVHDAFGRGIRTTTPSGLVHLTEYDDQAGTVTSAITPTGRLGDAELVTTRRTDPVARTSAESTMRADGVPTSATTSSADGWGRIVATDDGRSRTEVGFDVFGNPVRSTIGQHDGTAPPITIQRRFDAFGTSLEKRVAEGAWTATGGQRSTDVLGRVVAEADQRGRTRRIEYAADGQPERVTDGAGSGLMRSTRMSYDPRTGRPTGISTTSPVGDTVSTAIEYDDRGRVRAVLDPADPDDSRIAYTYDDFGNVLETRYPDGAVIAHDYDRHGRLTSVTDAAGRVTVRTFDEAGRLIEAVQHDGEADAPVLARAAYHYDAFDRVDRLELGNGLVTEYTFTSASEIATETTRRGDETVTEREYEYDDEGRLHRRVERVAGPEADASPPRSTAYRYDRAGRLIGSEVRVGADDAGPLLRSSEYGVSVAGDVDALVETSTAPDGTTEVRTREFEYSPVGELVAVTSDGVRVAQEYDGAGNLVRSADGATATYDAANRVRTRTAADGRVTSTTYWADGTRRTLTETPPAGRTGAEAARSTTTFHWSGDDLIDERHDTGGEAAAVSYLLGMSRHARIVGGSGGDAGPAPSARYLGTDRHGDVSELTDEQGRLVTRYDYTDYGVATETALAEASVRQDQDGTASPSTHASPADRNPFQYAGEYTDRDGTQPLGQRLYDAETMRFTTEDPARTEFTRYAYGDLNPVMRVDPTGEAGVDAVHWAVTALIVAASVVTTIMDVATAGTAAAVLGIVMLGVADVAVTVVDAANQQQHFLPESVAMTLGFVVAASGLLIAGVTKRGRTTAGTQGQELTNMAEAGQDAVAAQRAALLERDRHIHRLSRYWQSTHLVAVALLPSPSGASTLRARLKMLLDERFDLLIRMSRYRWDANELRKAGWPVESSEEYFGRERAWGKLAGDSAEIGEQMRQLAIWQRVEFGAYRDLWEWMRWYGLPREIVDRIEKYTFAVDGVELEDYVPVAISKIEGLITTNRLNQVDCCGEFPWSRRDWTARLQGHVAALKELMPAKRY